MKSKLWYIIPLLLLILGLLGPAIHANSPVQNPVPLDVVGGVTKLSSPALDSSGVTQNTAAIPSGISGINPDRKEASTTTVPGSSPAPSVGALFSPIESYNNEAVVVDIAVVGKNGELLFGPSRVKIVKKNPGGTTAMGVLAATGLSYQASKRFPDLVEDIAGLRNKGQSGWLFKVNDEVPLVAANKKPVVVNDRVIWWYSNSINDPAPSWEQLAQ